MDEAVLEITFSAKASRIIPEARPADPGQGRRRGLPAWLLAVAMAVAMILTAGPARAEEALSAAPAPAEVKIGVSVPMAVHGWTGAVVWRAKDEIGRLSQRYKNLDFLFYTANSPEKQLGDIQAMLAEGVVALVVLPVSDEPLAAVLEEAHKKGVFIVAVDRISPHLSRDVLVTADNARLGRLSGEIVAKAIDGKGRIAIMEALPSSINTMRVEAFKEVIARYPDIAIVDSQHVNWNPVTGLEVMEKFLRDHPHLDGIWTGDDSVLIRVLSVYRKSGRDDLKIIMGLGGAKEVVKMIMDGDSLVQATLNYPSSIISDSIRVAAEHVMDGKTFEPEVAIVCDLVDRTNARDFYNPDSLY